MLKDSEIGQYPTLKDGFADGLTDCLQSCIKSLTDQRRLQTEDYATISKPGRKGKYDISSIYFCGLPKNHKPTIHQQRAKNARNIEEDQCQVIRKDAAFLPRDKE